MSRPPVVPPPAEIVAAFSPAIVRALEQWINEAVAAGSPLAAQSPATPWLTAAQAGACLRPDAPDRGRRRVYELVADGRLTRHGDGRKLLITRAELEALIEGGTVTSR